jgi:hypothetical protein
MEILAKHSYTVSVKQAAEAIGVRFLSESETEEVLNGYLRRNAGWNRSRGENSDSILFETGYVFRNGYQQK